MNTESYTSTTGLASTQTVSSLLIQNSNILFQNLDFVWKSQMMQTRSDNSLNSDNSILYCYTLYLQGVLTKIWLTKLGSKLCCISRNVVSINILRKNNSNFYEQNFSNVMRKKSMKFRERGFSLYRLMKMPDLSKSWQKLSYQ